MSITRREFSLSLGALGTPVLPAAAQVLEPGAWDGPAVVRKAYIAIDPHTWPNPAVDTGREKAEIETKLAELERKHAGIVRFTGGEMLRTAAESQAWLKSPGDADAVLVIDLTSGTGGVLGPFQDAGLPVLLFSRPYSGWSYIDVVRWNQSGRKADLIVTSEYGDLDPYMRIFRAIHHLRRSKVLVISPGASRGSLAEGFTNHFGTSIAFPSYQDVKAAYSSVDADAAQRAAEEYTRGALRVVEPSPREITDALRFHLGILQLLKQEKANAVTIDCLGGFRRGDLPAYPCVAWSKLNDAGFYGVCEGDLASTMTQLLFTSLTGKPGFVSDPVFDTSRNEMIHAHCVAATAMQGIGGATSPYIIRSHMEDNKGVSVQVLMPIGETITVGKFHDAKKFAISTAEVIGNVDIDRGCRTKIRTRVPDARKMLEQYRGALHRVIVYGDCVRTVEQMGRLMQFEVIREC